MKDLKTFDLLLFSGKNPIGTLIETTQFLVQGNGNFSHVGVVLEGKYLPKLLDSEKLYVWESTVSFKIPDAISGICKDGVQIRELDKVIKYYDGKVAVGKLNAKLSEEQIQDAVNVIYKKFNGKKYVRNPCTLITSLCCCFRSFRSDGDEEGMFCSEFVGEIYKQLGIINKNLNPKDIIPVDFLGNDREGMEIVIDLNLKILSKE